MIEYLVVKPHSKEEIPLICESFAAHSLLVQRGHDVQVEQSGSHYVLHTQEKGPQGSFFTKLEDGFVLFHGWCVGVQFEDDRRLCESIHAAVLEGRALADLFADAFGEVSVFYQRGDRLEHFQTITGTRTVYYSRQPTANAYAIANRASLCAAAFPWMQSNINTEALIDVVACDQVIGQKSSIAKVFRLLPTEKIESRRGHLFVSDRQLLLPRIADISLGGAYDLCRDIVERMKLGVRRLLEIGLLSAQDSIPLSGGRDSRCILAMVTSAVGKAEKIKAHTVGIDTSDEVKAARMLCDQAQITHSVSVPSNSQVNFLDKLALHNFQLEGEISARILHGNFLGNRGPVLTGHEVFRETVVDDVEADDFAASIVDRYPLDPVGICGEKARERIRFELEERLFSFEALGVLPAQWKLFSRLLDRGARWVGKLTENSEPAGPYLNPFCTDAVMNAMAQIPEQFRALDILHFTLLNELNPEWLSVPFANQRWAEELRNSDFSGAHVTDKIVEQGTGSPGWWNVMLQDRERFAGILCCVIQDDAEDAFDARKLLATVSSGRHLGSRDVLSLFGVLGAASVIRMGSFGWEKVIEEKEYLHRLAKL